ncbi:AAA family ATPase [Desulfatibacillum aliphaticivorans]|uniref:AAA family ATPase n=1 Tax=Desulfatibacillum aliphaticivorans TaxID=218208 RepID=UPI000405C394|nr:ATP-binding protein [Desulfatibacillum aliphaticivorans]
MKPKIENLYVKNFRAFKDISIEGIGRVNLITGKNNTGKSSLIEAIRLLSSDATISVISNILDLREVIARGRGPQDNSSNFQDEFLLGSLFRGFPAFSDNILPIEIKSDGLQANLMLSIRAAWFSEEQVQDGINKWVPVQGHLFDEGNDVIPGVEIITSSGKRFLTLQRIQQSLYRPIIRPVVLDDMPFPCIYVSPYGGEKTSTLGPLWDKIALSDLEKDIVSALQIVDKRIKAVSMIGGEGRQSQRKAIVRVDGLISPVPLRSFGDGLNRLFGIVLSLVNARGGMLLIDEFENGMHYSVQEDVWRAIFKLSTQLDVQVIATSHSWDAIKAFQKVANEDPEEGVLIKLSRKGDEIIPTIFNENELLIATQNQIEVR